CVSRFFYRHRDPPALHSFPTRRSSDLLDRHQNQIAFGRKVPGGGFGDLRPGREMDEPVPQIDRRARSFTCGAESIPFGAAEYLRSEEHTSELQSRENLVCRLLLEKKKI